MHPVLFRVKLPWIGSFDVAYYGVLIAVGILLGAIIAVRRARQVGISAEVILDLAFFGIIIGFVGSRIVFIANNFDAFLETPAAYIFTRQGYVFLGGLIPAVAFGIWFVRRKRSDPWQIADVLAPSIPLGHTFGRVGCFMSGCCFGRVCGDGWDWLGVQFPKVVDPETGEIIFSFAYQQHLWQNLLAPGATRSLPVVPVQLFEAAGNFLIFLGLLWLWRRRYYRGQVFAGYLAAYGTMRFLLEFLRGDYGDPGIGEWLDRGHLSQLTCLLAIACAVGIWWLRHDTPLESPAAAGDAPENAPSAAKLSNPPAQRKPSKQKKHRRKRSNT